MVPAAPERGLLPGVIFTLRNLNQGVNVNQQNRLHPYYLVYINENGDVITNHTEVKRLLDLVRSACKGQNQPIPDVCQLLNQTTADGRNMQAYSDLLGKAIRSMIDVQEDIDLDSLFSGGHTTALVTPLPAWMTLSLLLFLLFKTRMRERMKDEG